MVVRSRARDRTPRARARLGSERLQSRGAPAGVLRGPAARGRRRPARPPGVGLRSTQARRGFGLGAVGVLTAMFALHSTEQALFLRLGSTHPLAPVRAAHLVDQLSTKEQWFATVVASSLRVATDASSTFGPRCICVRLTGVLHESGHRQSAQHRIPGSDSILDGHSAGRALATLCDRSRPLTRYSLFEQLRGAGKEDGAIPQIAKLAVAMGAASPRSTTSECPTYITSLHVQDTRDRLSAYTDS